MKHKSLIESSQESQEGIIVHIPEHEILCRFHLRERDGLLLFGYVPSWHMRGEWSDWKIPCRLTIEFYNKQNDRCVARLSHRVDLEPMSTAGDVAWWRFRCFDVLSRKGLGLQDVYARARIDPEFQTTPSSQLGV